MVVLTLPAQANTPRLKPGLWQFDRTTEEDGKKADRRVTDHLKLSPRSVRCVDPNASLRETFATNSLGICRLTNMKESDGEYRLSKQCGKGAPINMTVRATGETRFEQTTEGQIGGVRTRETIVGERIGDCRSSTDARGR